MSRMKPDLGRLVGVIAKDFDLAFARGAVHGRPDHTGRPREMHIRRFLADVLPGQYGVTSGYIIYKRLDVDRVVVDVSHEFDVIIYRKATCPNLVIEEGTGARLIPVDDVYGVIEAKSTLDEDTLDSALEKLDEIREIAHRAQMARPGGSKRRRDPPFKMVVSYRAKERFRAQAPLVDRLDQHRDGELRQPDAVVVLDQQIVVRGDEAIRRAFMVTTRCTFDETENNSEYQSLSAYDWAMADNRGHVPDFRSFPVEKGTGAIALTALLIGLLEEQRLVEYDVGELLSLIQPSQFELDL
jgi:hypothetical protein